MQAASSPALAPSHATPAVQAPIDSVARMWLAKRPILSTVIDVTLWVGIFGLASVLILPR